MKHKNITVSSVMIMIVISIILSGCAVTIPNFEKKNEIDNKKDISSTDSETNEESDNVVTNTDITYFENSDKIKEITETKKIGDIEIEKHITDYYESGKIAFEALYINDESGNSIEGTEIHYTESGVQTKREKKGEKITQTTTTTASGELVMKEIYTSDKYGGYETYTEYYIGGKIHHREERTINKESQNEYDGYIVTDYDSQGNIIYYNKGRASFYPLPDGKLLQLNCDDPADEMYIKMYFGEGEDEYIATCVLYDLDEETETYKSVRFEDIGSILSENEVKDLYNDYLEYKNSIDSIYNEWNKYVYG